MKLLYRKYFYEILNIDENVVFFFLFLSLFLSEIMNILITHILIINLRENA